MLNLRFTPAINDVQFANNDLKLLIRWYGGREIDVMDFDDELVKTYFFDFSPDITHAHRFAEKYFMDEFDRRRMRKGSRMT